MISAKGFTEIAMGGEGFVPRRRLSRSCSIKGTSTAAATLTAVYVLISWAAVCHTWPPFRPLRHP